MSPSASHGGSRSAVSRRTSQHPVGALAAPLHTLTDELDAHAVPKSGPNFVIFVEPSFVHAIEFAVVGPVYPGVP